uniref:AlNc14C111G6381 protein n=1 Tax=Albugo laibachii Nc14 TaxID=890382 RepID=F0WII1_9STRA|nr:AlNc14C111G6381 [Albugo laibachii Nc14]|eukprot:CCA21063.1 AlNc14C111G6381 [Albugo laibachii Nc14]
MRQGNFTQESEIEYRRVDYCGRDARGLFGEKTRWCVIIDNGGRIYRGPVVVMQMIGLRELLAEFEVNCNKPMVLYENNQAAPKHLEGDGASARSKHVDIPGKLFYASEPHDESGTGTETRGAKVSGRLEAGYQRDGIEAIIVVEILESQGEHFKSGVARSLPF